MQIFVTGATGFIGSALIPELLAAGHLGLPEGRLSVRMSVKSHAGKLVSNTHPPAT